jgi:hypothetical protein
MRSLALAAVVLAALAGRAAASGPTVPYPGTSWPGVTAPGGVHYMAFPRGGGTLLKAVRHRDARVLAHTLLHGLYGIPSPAFGAFGGLSGDGRTFVVEQLGSSRGFPRAASRFAVLDAHTLRVRRTVVLRGGYSFDAISPDGSRLYLTEHLDQIRYRIRTLDVASGRLLRSSVADYRDGGTTMRGWPVARATRAGWAFTLYVGGTRAFVHALDTVHARAVCVFLPWATSGTLYGGTLAVRGAILQARLFAHAFAAVTIDARTLRVVA